MPCCSWPLSRWRHVAITQQRTMQDFAHQMRWLVGEAYPEVPVIRVVLDNLNTHRMASLYETLPPAEARRIVKRLGFHHTPEHGSWLNMAEIEFSVLARACLRGRNPNEDVLRRAIGAYEEERNTVGATINWRFTAQQARADRNVDTCSIVPVLSPPDLRRFRLTFYEG